jgi:hypothetical protein
VVSAAEDADGKPTGAKPKRQTLRVHSCGLAIELQIALPVLPTAVPRAVGTTCPRELDPNDWDVMSLRTRTKCLVPAHYSISGTRLTEHVFPLSFIGSC